MVPDWSNFAFLARRLPGVALMWAVVVGLAHGALATLDSRMLADSPEDFSQRIYGYDMAVDANNDVHVVYSRPTGSGSDQVVYVRRAAGQWQGEQVLSADGLRSSISTHLVVGGDNAVHVSYLRRSTEALYYRRIVNGVPQPEKLVDIGQWNTLMQLDGAGRPLFVRENETQPGPISKLALLSTTDGNSWSKSFLNLPGVNRFRLAGFVFENGRHHLIYGDSALLKPVLSGKGSTTYVTGVFHNLYYAFSANGVSWTPNAVDQSGTLYENEFWASLAVDGGQPIVGMYRYAEYGGEYNTGTSALLARWTGGAWDKRFTTASYPDSREGAALALLVDAPEAYLGAWDFSPDDTQNAYFRGERGNIALVRNGTRGDWQEKLQIDPFSAEGRVVLRKRGDRLHFLALGDFVDARLYYREFDLNYIDEEFDRIYGGFPWEIFLPGIVNGALKR